jgi:hypothetical protein
MDDLHRRLAEKMRERPESNEKGAWGADGVWVYKHLAAGDRQFLLTYYPNGEFTAYAADRRRGSHNFWAAPDGSQGGWRNHTRAPYPVPQADASVVLSAVPLPQPDSVWAYTPLAGRPPAAVGYWQCSKNEAAAPLRFCQFTLDGPHAGRFAENAAKWWPFVDAGEVRCLDEAVASGRSTLVTELDGNGYFKLVLDGSDYLAIDPLPVPPIRKLGPRDGMMLAAQRCIKNRAAAASALRGM